MAADTARWRRPKALFLLFLALACLAFVSLRKLGGTTGSALEDAYHSIGIFTANGSWAFDPANHVNTLFKVLATATPVVTFIGFVEVLTGGVLPFIIRRKTLARLRLGGQGTIVVGLNDHGLAFANAVAQSGATVLILDDAPGHGLAEPTPRRPIPVLPLASLNTPGLANALLKNCDLISFLAATDRQVDLVTRINALIGPATDRSFWFLIHERGLAQRLDGYLRFTASHATLRPRFFDIDALAARQVLARHQLDQLADAANQTQIHIAIFGFGALGRAIVKEAARGVVALPSLSGTKLKVTVIDAKGAHAATALEAEDPQIHQLLDLNAVPFTLQPAGLLADQLHLIPDDITAYFITVGDAELAFATAVSLRHWLLEPPACLDENWRHAHPCVPILIRVRTWEGLGRLIRSNVDWPAGADRAPELPDGIFGFGVTQDVLDPAFIMSPARETGARVLHQSYRAAGEALRLSAGNADSARVAERAWRELATDLRDLNLYGFDHIPMKARAIGHRIVPGSGPPGIPASVLPMLGLLSHLEHCRYFAERAAGGWRLAATRCDELRLHPALVPWTDLPSSEQRLDEDQIHAVFHALAATGQRMLPAHCTAIIGQRDLPVGGAAALRAALTPPPGTAPVILTTLSPGAGMLAAEAARSLGIPWIAVLPLPFELYREEFSPEERRRLQALISFAELYVELPLRFGKASELTGAPPRRARQHALAAAFMVERAHALLVLGTPDDTCSEALAWFRNERPIPEAYRSRPAFLPRPNHRAPPVHVPRP
jgi:hypothetical protein